MGQYYKIVNLTKKQFMFPHNFGDGAKLCEFGSSGTGTMFALAALLASGNGRGGGDINSDDPIIGSWAGDQIVITGDYDDDGKYGVPNSTNLYSYAGEEYKDISEEIKKAMKAAGEYVGDRRF